MSAVSTECNNKNVFHASRILKDLNERLRETKGLRNNKKETPWLRWVRTHNSATRGRLETNRSLLTLEAPPNNKVFQDV